MGVLSKIGVMWYSIVLVAFGILVGIAFFDESSNYLGYPLVWLLGNIDRLLGTGGLVVGVIGVIYGWRGERAKQLEEKKIIEKEQARIKLLASRRDITLAVNIVGTSMSRFVGWKALVVDNPDLAEKTEQEKKIDINTQNTEYYNQFQKDYKYALNLMGKYENKDAHEMHARRMIWAFEFVVNSFAIGAYDSVGKRYRLNKPTMDVFYLIQLLGFDKETETIDILNANELRTKVENELRPLEWQFPLPLV